MLVLKSTHKIHTKVYGFDKIKILRIWTLEKSIVKFKKEVHSQNIFSTRLF